MEPANSVTVKPHGNHDETSIRKRESYKKPQSVKQRARGLEEHNKVLETNDVFNNDK